MNVSVNVYEPPILVKVYAIEGSIIRTKKLPPLWGDMTLKKGDRYETIKY